MRVRVVTRISVVAAALAVLAALAASAGAQTFQVGLPSECSAAPRNSSNPGQDRCLLVENRARDFGVTGSLSRMPLRRTDVSMAKGSWVGGSSEATNPGSFWAQFGIGFSGLRGTVSYAPATGPLAAEPVQIQVGETGSETRLVRCINIRFFTCEVPETVQPLTGGGIYGQIPASVAVVTTHPVILKIVNQTDQWLKRSTDLRLTGFVADSESTSEIMTRSIAPLERSQQGQAYYHLYRDLSVDNNATVEYQFGAGGTGVLTGGIIGISVTIDKNGVATGSCNAPQGLLVNVSCTVRILGIPEEGPTIAVVSVAV